jgi:ribosomal protein L33
LTLEIVREPSSAVDAKRVKCAKSTVRALKSRPNSTKSWEKLENEKFSPSARKA